MSNKGKHLNYYERVKIQQGLELGYTLNELSTYVSRCPRTISFEIKRNMYKQQNNTYKWMGVEKGNCMQHIRYPYVCDTCLKKRGCVSDKYSYDAQVAEEKASKRLTNSRNGINLTSEELENITIILKQGLKQGQSIEHIIASNPNFPLSVRSVYRHIDNETIAIKNIELRRKVKLKPRKNNYPKNSLALSDDKTYFAYLDYTFNNNVKSSVEMDIVEGLRTDKKVILTLYWTETRFLYAILLPNKSQTSVIEAFNQLEELIGIEKFKELFQVILTDRDPAFRNYSSLETNHLGEQRTKVFYCDPMASHQKGKVEAIHRILRYILPKKHSINFLTRKKLSLILSHINSSKYKSNHFYTGYKLMELRYGSELLEKIKVEEINPDQINLTPSLVR